MTRKKMQRQSLSFAVIFLITFISGIVVSGPSTLLRRRVRHQNIKVRINATGDTIVLKFLLPNAHTKLEGYILGYGSRLFSKQFIQLPENGLPFVREFDAEPKYLIAVKPIQINEVKKYCKGKVELEKPLNLIVGPVTPSSVLLSWGDTLKNPYTANILKECLEEGHYTVRYREKDKKWNYQTCPTSDTVIDNLKPNVVYEFGVKPISKEGSGEWSKPVVHNTSNVKMAEKPIKTIIKHPINPAKPLGPRPHSPPFASMHAPSKTTRQDSVSSGFTQQTGEDLSRSVLPLDIALTTASQTYMAKCDEHHHNQPQKIPQSKPQSQHLPKETQHPKHTPLNDSQKQLPSTSLPPKHDPKKLPPDIDPYPTYFTPQTNPQTKAQPTLQPQNQMSVQPVNQLPSDPKLVTDSHLRFQPTLKPLQSLHLIPEQPHLQPTPNLIPITSQQTQILHPNSPTNSQTKLTSETTPSNNIQQPIYPKFQPRMPKPPPLSTPLPIPQTQSEVQQRSKPKRQNELEPELQPWTEEQFHEYTSEAQSQQATDSIFQTQKQTQFLPTTETQTQHWPTSQAKPQKKTQTHLNNILLPQTANKKQPQTTNKSTVQTKRPAQLTLSPIASNEHQEQRQPTLEPFVQTQQPVTQPMTTAPLPLKSTSQNQLQNREQHQTEAPIQFQFTSEPKAQDEKQVKATLQPKSQTEQQPQLHPPSKLNTQKKPYPQAPTTRQKPQPTTKPIFHFQPPPQPTLLSNIQNDPYPESQPAYLPKSYPQQHPQSQPTSKSIHQTQPPLHQTSTVNLQTELFPQSQPESQFPHQPQQPQSTLNSIPQTQEISQPTSPAKHHNEPTSYQQFQKTFQVQTHLYTSQIQPTVTPILNTQPEVETTVHDMSELQQPESEPIFQPKPTLYSFLESISSTKYQNKPYPESDQTFQTQHHLYESKPRPSLKPILHTQPQVQPTVQESKIQQPESKLILQPKLQLKPHKEPYPQPQPTVPSEQPQSHSKSQSTAQNESYRKAQPPPEAQTQINKMDPTKTSQQPWKEFHSSPPQPTDQIIPISHQQQQFQPTLETIVQTQPYKQSQPLPQQPLIQSTSIPILPKQTTTKSALPVKPKEEPYPKSQPLLHAIPNPQQHPQPSPPQSKPQTKLHPHEPKPTAIPTFLSQSQPTLHIPSNNQPYPESQPLVQTTLHFQQRPQPKSTQKPTLQPDLLPKSTSEFKPHNKFHSQSQPAFPSISQPQESKSTSRPMHQTKIPTKAASQPTPKNEPPPQLKQTLQTKHQPKHQHNQPTLNTTPQTQSQKRLPPVLNIQPQTTPSLKSKPENGLQPQHQQLFHLDAHTQKQPQLSATLHPMLQTKPQQTQQPTYKTQIPLQPRSQTQYSHYQSTSQPSQSVHSPVFTPIFQIPTHSTPHPMLQMQSQTQPGNKPILQTQLQESIPQPTHHPQPETKQQSLSHPTSQSLHQYKSQQTTQPTNQIPNHQAFQPTHKNLLETQSKSELNSQKKSQPQQQIPTHSEPQIPKQPQKKTNGKNFKKPRPKPKFPRLPPTRSEHPTDVQQPKPTPIFQKKPQSQSHAASQYHPWTQEQQKMQSTSKPLLQTQQNLQFTFKNQTYTTLQPKVWITPALEHITQNPEAEKKIQMTLPPNVYSQKTVQPQPKRQKQPQLQPTIQAVPESQSFSQPQPRSTTTTKMQTTSKPLLQTHQSQHKLTSRPKLHVQETTMLSVQPQTRASAERTSHPMTPSQSIPLPHLSPKIHSQPETVSKQHSTTWPQVQPQPGLQTESQTRTYTDPTKITPGQTLIMAPSAPEEGKPLPRPELATENAGSYNEGTGVLVSPKGEAPRSPASSSAPPTQRDTPLSHPRVRQHPSRPFSTSKTIQSRITSTTKATGMPHGGNDLSNPVRSEENPSKVNQDKPRDPKLRNKEDILKQRPVVTPRPRQERRQETTTAAPTVNSTSFNVSENSTVFSPSPTSDVDATGRKRFVAPHVIYKTDKKPEEPCSITSSLSYFPDEEANDLNVTSPPRIPPSNLTVVTVEGCPSFVILDWQKSDNETKEYEILSTTKGESGVEKSVVTTNQTHTAVENLKPESNYEFIVTPKNELGTGPPTDPVSFITESADPRVSEYVSGKNSIWSDFPFRSTGDAYSECDGRMFVKRTWYRKFVGIQLCNSLRYQIYLSDSLNGKFYNIGDLTGEGEDHCQFVDSFLDGNTGSQIPVNELPKRPGFYRAMRHEPVSFGEVGGNSHATYVGWYECGTPIPGKW